MDDYLKYLKDNPTERKKCIKDMANDRFEGWLYERYNQRELYGTMYKIKDSDEDDDADYSISDSDGTSELNSEEKATLRELLGKLRKQRENIEIEYYDQESEEDVLWSEMMDDAEVHFRKLIVEFFEAKNFNTANIVDFFLNIDNDIIKNYDSIIKSKILVIGRSEVRKKDLLGIIKSYGLNEDLFEFVLEYDNAKNYNFNKLRNNEKYQAVMIGPIPHKIRGIDTNLISKLEKNEEYPHTIRLINGNDELKISKSTFSKTLDFLIQEKILVI